MSYDFSDGFYMNPDFLKNRLEESTDTTDGKKASEVTDKPEEMNEVDIEEDMELD